MNSLLDFSRVEAGRVVANFEPMDLAKFTAELASNFKSATEKAGLALRIDCPEVDRPVYVDREMWEKIVLNLVSNAFKFTFAGEIAVELRKAADQQGVELIVRDTGVGVPQSELPRLFERFHRIEGQRSRSFEGSGIGLGSGAGAGEAAWRRPFEPRASWARARRLSYPSLLERRIFPRKMSARNAHALEVAARRSVRRRGAALASPRRASGATEDRAEEASELTCAGRADGARIVVADDNADMRDYIRRLLGPVGAWRRFPTARTRWKHPGEKPDLVLTDVMMPRLDGFGLLPKFARSRACATCR